MNLEKPTIIVSIALILSLLWIAYDLGRVHESNHVSNMVEMIDKQRVTLSQVQNILNQIQMDKGTANAFESIGFKADVAGDSTSSNGRSPKAR